MIDNFKVIDNFLQFEEGTFYKFELLVRNTDGNNDLYQEGYSKTNKNILIKSWYVDSKDYYEKIKHEMITMADLTGARIYITLDRKDNVKLVNGLLHRLCDTLTAICNGQKPTIKNISKIMASETSKVENSSKNTKTLMWDVDTKQIEVVNHIHEYIRSKGQEPFTLKTKKGYHVVCFRKFNHSDWLDWCVEHEYKHTKFENKIAEKDFKTTYKNLLQGLVSVKENELGLVYHPMKNLNFIIDWQTKDQPKDAYLHKKEFKSLDEARIFMKQLKEDKNVCYIDKNKIKIEDLTKCEIIGEIE